MPTQEEINAAQVELDIANDNYARLANKYNSYLKVFDAYKNASPETQQRAQGVMQRMMNNFEDLKLNMYAAEDRIAVAQNRVNEINSIVPTVTTTAPARRRTVVPSTPIIEPAIEETIVNPNNSFGGAGWVNNNGTLISPDGATKVNPDGSIEFNGVTTPTKYNQNYYETYAQMKGTGTPSAQIADWFRGGLGQANSRNASLVWNDLAKRGLTNQQIEDFMQDWGNATLAPRSVQYNLGSPQKIKTWGNENAPQNLSTWGTANPNSPLLLNNM